MLADTSSSLPPAIPASLLNATVSLPACLMASRATFRALAMWRALSSARSMREASAAALVESNLSAFSILLSCFCAAPADLVIELMALFTGVASAPSLSVSPLNASAMPGLLS